MNESTLLHILMAVHTLIGAVSTACLVYLFVAAWKGRSPAKDPFLAFALIWPLANLTLMAFNGMVCPLQDAARTLTGQEEGWVRDIYWVPEGWLKIIPWTYPAFYLAGVVLVFGRLWAKKLPKIR